MPVSGIYRLTFFLKYAFFHLAYKDFLFKYSWYSILHQLHQFQVYNIVIQYFYILQCNHPLILVIICHCQSIFISSYNKTCQDIVTDLNHLCHSLLSCLNISGVSGSLPTFLLSIDSPVLGPSSSRDPRRGTAHSLCTSTVAQGCVSTCSFSNIL